METLNYSGRLAVSTQYNGPDGVVEELPDGEDVDETQYDEIVPDEERQRLHQLLDDAIDAFEGDQLTMRTAVVHFERADGDETMPRAHIEVDAHGELASLDSVQQELAATIVDIGMEADEETAIDQISLE